jgi:hypothetical protein
MVEDADRSRVAGVRSGSKVVSRRGEVVGRGGEVVPIPSQRVRVCGGTAGTVNVGSRAPAKPLFYMALREGGPTATNGRRPRSGRAPNQGASQIGIPRRDPIRR